MSYADFLRAKTDVETLAVGWWAGMSGTMLLPPWDSDAVSEQIGVQPPTDRRHTAMGDAEWARAIFDHVSARMPPERHGSPFLALREAGHATGRQTAT